MLDKRRSCLILWKTKSLDSIVGVDGEVKKAFPYT